MDSMVTVIIWPVVAGIIVAIFQWLLPSRDKIKIEQWTGRFFRKCFCKKTNVQTLTVSSDGNDTSKFIRDVTIPDGSLVKMGATIEKVWEIQNTGQVVWEDRFLKREGACDGVGLLSSPDKVAIPLTRPGEIVQIKITMKAPRLPTTTTCLWKMVDKNGKKCFPGQCGLSMTVIVTE